jgi:hypothetical protein
MAEAQRLGERPSEILNSIVRSDFVAYDRRCAQQDDLKNGTQTLRIQERWAPCCAT